MPAACSGTSRPTAGPTTSASEAHCGRGRLPHEAPPRPPRRVAARSRPPEPRRSRARPIGLPRAGKPRYRRSSPVHGRTRLVAVDRPAVVPRRDDLAFAGSTPRRGTGASHAPCCSGASGGAHRPADIKEGRIDRRSHRRPRAGRDSVAVLDLGGITNRVPNQPAEAPSVRTAARPRHRRSHPPRRRGPERPRPRRRARARRRHGRERGPGLPALRHDDVDAGIHGPARLAASPTEDDRACLVRDRDQPGFGSPQKNETYDPDPARGTAEVAPPAATQDQVDAERAIRERAPCATTRRSPGFVPG